MNNEKLKKTDLKEKKEELEILIFNACFGLDMMEANLKKVKELLGE